MGQFYKKNKFMGFMLHVNLVVITSLISGCDKSGCQAINMIPDSYEVMRRSTKTVEVSVTGGQDFDIDFLSHLSDSEFRGAIEQAILRSQIFSQVLSQPGTDYGLKVTILNIKRPKGGNRTFEIRLIAMWELIDQKLERTVWKDSVVSEAEATMDEEFVGLDRMKLATERAAKKNIKLGIEALSRVEMTH